MKKCPFCAEEIQDEAIKCRFCGEFLNRSYRPDSQIKWYQSTATIILAIFIIGPFALPLVWRHPTYKPVTKIVITIIVILITILACIIIIELIKILLNRFKDLGLEEYMK